MPSSSCPARSSVISLVVGAVTLGGVIGYSLHRMKKKIRLGAAIWSKSWFSELSSMWPGQAFSLRVEKELYDEKSEFQVWG